MYIYIYMICTFRFGLSEMGAYQITPTANVAKYRANAEKPWGLKVPYLSRTNPRLSFGGVYAPFLFEHPNMVV